MRGDDGIFGSLFSYIDLEKRVRADHPLRAIRQIANAALRSLSGEFDKLYSPIGRPSSRTTGITIWLAAAAWAVLVWHRRDINMDMASPAMGLRAALFLAMWVVMMVAMMFPTAAPMILAFHQVQVSKRQSDDAFVSAWAFVTAYLLVWTLAGVAAYAVVSGIEIPAIHNAFGPKSVAQFSGAILIAAGIYQLTPLKEACLYECRTPINTTSWYREKTGAFRLGLHHGAYCVGCYWLLFAILFPFGMSIGAMAVVTLIILAEKTLSRPTLVSYATGAVLVLYGALVITSPQLLPS
jgi:predicted metal-binding membrane protein